MSKVEKERQREYKKRNYKDEDYQNAFYIYM